MIARTPSDAQELLRSVYPELKRIAAGLLRRERREHTLQRTALVHEFFLRLGGKSLAAERPAQEVLAIAAHQMRQVLIDHGRKRGAVKRGGEFARVPLFEAEGELLRDEDSLLALDQALERLGELDARALSVVEFKFLVGFTNAETAAALGVSDGTVEAVWQHARLWLYKELNTPAPRQASVPLRRFTGSCQRA